MPRKKPQKIGKKSAAKKSPRTGLSSKRRRNTMRAKASAPPLRTTFERKSFDTPDETRGHLDNMGKAQVISIGGLTLIRGTFEPGWRWTSHVKPIAGTDYCPLPHTGYMVEGRMVVRLEDGSELEYAAGDAFYMPPGHDAWTVGDQRCVFITVTGLSK